MLGLELGDTQHNYPKVLMPPQNRRGLGMSPFIPWASTLVSTRCTLQLHIPRCEASQHIRAELQVYQLQTQCSCLGEVKDFLHGVIDEPEVYQGVLNQTV